MSKRAASEQDASQPMPMTAAHAAVSADPAAQLVHSFAPSAAPAADPITSVALSDASALPPPALKRPKKGNIFLTNEQRQALCIKAATSKVTQAQLCFWAKDEFALSGPLNQSTVSRILAEKDKYIAIESNTLTQKRKTYVEHPQLEAALSHWLLVQSHNNQRLQGDVIKEKGRAFAQLLGIDSKISFSNGWLTGFKKRHQTILSNASSESGAFAPVLSGSVALAADVASGATSTGVVADLGSWGLQQILQNYSTRDIFSMDETGLFYAMAPEKTVRKGKDAVGAAHGGVRGVLKQSATKEKLTLLLAVNADGSERLEPLFIGSGRRPTANSLTAASTAAGRKKLQQQQLNAMDAGAGGGAGEPSFNYSYSERTWMNAIVFQKWLNTLNSQMKIENRHILLLIDDAPSHITRGLKLTNIRVLKLPSNAAASNSSSSSHGLGGAASLAQPLELGIVAAFKRRYRKRQMVHALDRHEAGDADIFRVDELQAMKWCRAAWNDVPKSLVVRSWLHSHLFGDVMLAALAKDDVHIDECENELDALIKEISYKLPLKRVMALKEILSPPEESESLHFVGATDADYLSISDELPGVQVSGNMSSSSNNVSSSGEARDGGGSSALSSGSVGVQAPATTATSVDMAAPQLSSSVANPPEQSRASSSDDNAETTSNSAALIHTDARAAAHSHASELNQHQQQLAREDSQLSDEELLAYVQKIVPNLERLGCDERTIQSMREVRQSLKQRLALAAKSKAGDSAASIVI